MNISEQPLRRALRVEEFTGDVAVFEERMAAYDRDFAVLADSYQQLMREHPDEWVACSNGRILAARSLFQLFHLLREAGIDPAGTPASFMTTKALALSLL